MGGTGARINLPPALASATYDANNRLTNWAGTVHSYDFNGNLTGNGVQSYTWDTRDRLTAISGGGVAASFGYDALDRRVTRTVSGTQTGTLYDGFSEVHNLSGTTITSTLLNGLGLDERYARTQGGVTLSILPDALGSTVNLVSPGGAMTGTFTYEPYGASTQSGVDSTAFRYTGREEDGTGLMYYRNRYYDPRISRFVSEDPIGLQGGYNLYAYVGGDPVAYSDPTGELPIIPVVIAAEILGVGALSYMSVASQHQFNQSQSEVAVVIYRACLNGLDAACREVTARREWDQYVSTFKMREDLQKAFNAPKEISQMSKIGDIIDRCKAWIWKR